MATIRSIALTLVNQRHSKSYSASIEEKGDLFVVNFSYGAVGSIQRPGTKTPAPVDLATAERIYAKLIAEKCDRPCECCGGVYAVAEETGSRPTPPVARAVAASVKPAAVQIDLGSKLVDGLKRDPVAQDVHPRFMPALLEAISTDQAGNYVTNPAYGAERKYDGHRHAISHVNGHTVSFNRLGKQIPIPSEVALQLLSIQPMVGRRYMLDGEYVGGEYMAFDLIEMGWTAEEAASYREEPYSQRHADLTKLLGGTGIKVAPLAKTEAEKMAMIATEVEHRGEGIVFHHLGKGYMPGRQGVDVKFKLWSSATLRICAKKKQDGHNSFAVEAWKLIDGKQVWVNVGRVTLTKSPTPPAIGTYREVKMLYLGVGERLYQPEDLGERTDVTDEDCAFSKLKLKQAAERLV